MQKRKIIIPLSLFLSFYLTQAQLIMIDGETGEYKYEEVVDAPGLSASQISQRANVWLSEYYPSEEGAKIDSVGLSRLASRPIRWTLIKKHINIEIFFDVEIKVKDGRYKYAFSNFREGKLVRGELQSMPLKTYIERFPQAYQIYIEEPVDNEMMQAISSLVYYVQNNSFEISEEDW